MHTFTFPRKCGGSGGVSHGLCGVGAMPVRAGGPGGTGRGRYRVTVVMWSCGHVIWFSCVK